MGRLTKNFEDGNGNVKCFASCRSCNGCICTDVYTMIDKLAHYEDLEEAGRLIELPCAVGDTIYEIHDGEIRTNRLVTKWRIARYLEEGFFGELVFTTKEEAERKLKELEGE